MTTRMIYTPKKREVKNPLYTGKCKFCGQEFESNKPFALFCCANCRTHYYRSEGKKTILVMRQESNKPVKVETKHEKTAPTTKSDLYKSMRERFGSKMVYRSDSRNECREQLEETLKDVGILKKNEKLVTQGKNKNLRGTLEYKRNLKTLEVEMTYKGF